MRKGRDIMWTQQIINTKRGTFEIFTKGNGETLVTQQKPIQKKN